MNISKEITELYKKLEETIEGYLNDFDKKKLKIAFYHSCKEFGQQKNRYGKLKIVHLLNTSMKLASLQAGIPSIIAGLLHSCIIETNHRKKEFEKKFGKEVTKLIIGVNQIKAIKYEEGMTTRDMDFLKNFFKIGGKDLRVIFIKICEKIDSIEDIEHVSEELRRETAIEVTEIYSPMIKIFGIGKFFYNIEDTCYKYIHPKDFENISNILEKNKEIYNDRLNKIKGEVESYIIEENIDASVESRIKSISSIAKKIRDKGLSIKGIFDVIAFRIIVENKRDAYIALGMMHSHFKVRGKRIKDYISAPKANGYQSLHTTLSDNEGNFFEVQIQTKEMYKLNSFGLASHSGYKGISSSNKSLPEWMQDILQNQKKQISGEELIDSLNMGNIKDTISCETPRGEIIELPKGSTIIDFAFKIHTQVGKKIKGAWINNEYSENLIQYIKDGDKIKLEVGKKESDYPVKYISYVKTNLAKKSLKKILKNKSIEKRILLGEHLLSNKMQILGYKSMSKMPTFLQKEILKRMNFETEKELYLEIGGGNIDVNKIIDLIYNLGNEKEKYTNTVSLKIELKKKDHNNLYLISNVFHNLDINVINIDYKGLNIFSEIYVKNFKNLQELLSELSRVPNVKHVRRRLTNKNIGFISIIMLTGFFILLSPFILFFFENFFNLSSIIYEILFYINIFFFVFTLYLFKNMAKNILPGLIRQNIFWISMIILNTITLITVIIESIYVFNNNNSVFFFSIILLLYGLTIFEFIDSKVKNKDEIQ